MNNVNSITLPAQQSPLRGLSIGEDPQLSGFDLIVLHGPNGAGKSEIVKALQMNVGTLNIVNGVEPIDLADANVDQGLLVRTGHTLMDPFTSMDDALARASGLRLIRDYGQLVGRLLNNAQNAAYGLHKRRPEETPERTQQLNDAIAQYLNAEQNLFGNALPPYPLTLQQYNITGEQVAQLMILDWQHQEAIDQGQMNDAEGAIRPQAWTPNGGPQLDQALADAIAGMGANVDPLAAAAGGRETELHETEKAARALAPLSPDEEPPASPHGWAARCRRLATECEEAKAAVDAQLESLNQLTVIRQSAREWIANREGEVGACPVCDQAVDAGNLVASLDAALAAEDDPRFVGLSDKSVKLHARVRALNDAAGRLEQAKDAFDRSVATILNQIATWSSQAQTLHEAVQPAVDWDVEVSTDANAVRTMAAQLLEVLRELVPDQLPSQQLTSARDSVSTLRTQLRDKQATRQAAAQTAQDALGPATAAFQRLQSLRNVLVAREALNQVAWGPSWEQEKINEEKNTVVDTWMEAARELHDEYEKKEQATQRTVLADDGVKARFRRLIEKVGHPLLKGAALTGSAIQQSQSDVHTKLSEGYQVIANLAAFIAVTGYVSDASEHKAGWIVLDEPTNGLDPENRVIVAQYLGGLTPSDMPRQMFVTTFEDKFRRELINAAIDCRRTVLEVSLPRWTGDQVTPQIREHTQPL